MIPLSSGSYHWCKIEVNYAKLDRDISVREPTLGGGECWGRQERVVCKTCVYA